MINHLSTNGEWAAEHLKAGKAVYPNSLYVYDSKTGWQNSPNLNMPKFKTNSKGMRNTQEFSLVPPQGRKRMIILGDSYLFGFEVSNEETTSYVLNKEYLNDWEIINMAVPGTGNRPAVTDLRILR